MQKPASSRPRLPESVRIFLTGAAMGIADLIPGVSGGTMAFILGIYDQLLDAIKSFNLTLLRLLGQFKIKEAFAQIPWRFLIPLGLGLGTAIISMARLMQYLLENQPVFLFSFFFGLILASIIAVGSHVPWVPSTLVALVIGTIGAYIIVGLVPLNMPNDPLTLFLSSTVAIMAMILPGISGSFILLILGQYAYVLNAVSNLDIITLIPVALGAAVGLLGFARVLSWLLGRYHDVTVAVLVGFLIGSLRKIWPWKEVLETGFDRHGEVIPLRERNILPDFAGPEVWIALGLALIGFVLLCYIDHLQSGNNLLFRMFKRPAAAGSSDTVTR